MENVIRTLDVRDDINAGQHPLGKILAAVDALKPCEALRLIAPFQPTPLISMLQARGFSVQVSELASGDFQVTFSQEVHEALVKGGDGNSGKAQTLDLKGLMPPEPMVRALEAATGLSPGEELVVITDRKPIHLLEELERRGFGVKSETLCHEHTSTRITRN